MTDSKFICLWKHGFDKLKHLVHSHDPPNFMISMTSKRSSGSNTAHGYNRYKSWRHWTPRTQSKKKKKAVSSLFWRTHLDRQSQRAIDASHGIINLKIKLIKNNRFADRLNYDTSLAHCHCPPHIFKTNLILIFITRGDPSMVRHVVGSFRVIR